MRFCPAKPPDEKTLDPYKCVELTSITASKRNSISYSLLQDYLCKLGYDKKLFFLVLEEGVRFDPCCPNAGTISFKYIFYDGRKGSTTFDTSLISGKGNVCAYCNYSDGIMRLTPMGFSWKNLLAFILTDAKFKKAQYSCIHINIEKTFVELTPLNPCQYAHDLPDPLKYDTRAIAIQFKLEFDKIVSYMHVLQNETLTHIVFSHEIKYCDSIDLAYLNVLAKSLISRYMKSDRCYLILL